MELKWCPHLSHSNFMRQECLDSRFVFDRPLPTSRLVSLIGSSILFSGAGFECLHHQWLYCSFSWIPIWINVAALHVVKIVIFNWTLRNPNPNTEIWEEALWCWPSHCWLWCKFAQSNVFKLLRITLFCILARVKSSQALYLKMSDHWCVAQDMGPHIFQTCPSANYFDCKAMSIGARSQSARTYLERCMDKFSDCKILFTPVTPHTPSKVCSWAQMFFSFG